MTSQFGKKDVTIVPGASAGNSGKITRSKNVIMIVRGEGHQTVSTKAISADDSKSKRKQL